MGFGNYSFEAHRALTVARGDKQASEVFGQGDIHPKMNPKGVKLRESRDSKEHPNSIPICFALDISGSMGDIPDLLARRELPTFMKLLMDCGIADPQILFMAFVDARCDPTPLQVGQFESTAELIDKWLTTTSFSGHDGSSYSGPLEGGESYELALHFAARHTKTDAFEKRKHRGYLFMTGDEPAYPAVPRETVQLVLGYDPERDIPIEEVMKDVRRTWQPFFLIPDAQRRSVEAYWRGVFGRDVLCMESAEDTCAVSASLVALGEDVVKDAAGIEVALRRGGLDDARIARTLTALRPWLDAK